MVGKRKHGTVSPPWTQPWVRSIYHDSGWIEVWRDVNDSSLSVPSYSSIFERSRVSEEVLVTLCTVIVEGVQAGILVYALRPPASRPMAHLEDLASGYDEDRLREAVTAAGARWLTVESTDFATFDGSHLVPRAARLDSTRVAHAIHVEQGRRPPVGDSGPRSELHDRQ